MQDAGLYYISDKSNVVSHIISKLAVLTMYSKGDVTC